MRSISRAEFETGVLEAYKIRGQRVPGGGVAKSPAKKATRKATAKKRATKSKKR